MRKNELNDLLDHVPELVALYGRWPSYVYLFVATLFVQGVVIAACIVGLYRLMR